MVACSTWQQSRAHLLINVSRRCRIARSVNTIVDRIKEKSFKDSRRFTVFHRMSGKDVERAISANG